MTMTDREIVALLFARSEKAIEALQEKYDRLIRRIAMNILHCDADAEECASDTYLSVWNTIPPQEPDPLLPYVARIARNFSLDRYRYNHAARRYAGHEAVLEEIAEIVSDQSDVEDDATRAALADAVSEFLKEQKDADRRLFLRRYWYGDAVSTLAQDFGISPNSAAVRLHRIRERLHRYLTERGFVL